MSNNDTPSSRTGQSGGSRSATLPYDNTTRNDTNRESRDSRVDIAKRARLEDSPAKNTRQNKKNRKDGGNEGQPFVTNLQKDKSRNMDGVSRSATLPKQSMNRSATLPEHIMTGTTTSGGSRSTSLPCENTTRNDTSQESRDSGVDVAKRARMEDSPAKNTRQNKKNRKEGGNRVVKRTVAQQGPRIQNHVVETMIIVSPEKQKESNEEVRNENTLVYHVLLQKLIN